MNRGTKRALCCAAFLLLVLMCLPLQMRAVGWTPTDGGLVVNLEQGDRFLLSVMVDHDNNPATPDREYFVGNYTRYSGDDYFKYDGGYFLKLFRQAADATKPSEMTVWTVGAPLSRVDVNNVAGGGKNKDYSLGGIVYTIWNDDKTLKTMDGSSFRFFGDLTSDYNHKEACDVVFIVPTNQASRTSFDPNRTLYKVRGRTDQASDGKINGRTGTGFLGMTYREVYMLEIPRWNKEIAYTNAALVTFNTTTSPIKFSNNEATAAAGRAYYAYADNKHKPTTRTLFRLYMLDNPITTCNSYFFATNVQDYKKYRNKSSNMSDSVAAKKVYSWDYFFCMDTIKGTTSFRTDYVSIPVNDSTYYYVGYENDYRNGSGVTPPERLGGSGAHSQFEKIRTLPMKDLAGMYAPANAYGRMVVDTNSSDPNLGVKFEPKGYFLKVSTGTNVRMEPSNSNPDVWITEEMWRITDAFYALSLKATLMTGPEFSESDPGADIDGWSEMMTGEQIDQQSPQDFLNKAGWAIIDTKSTDKNGHIQFFLADTTLRIHYDNNGFLGTQIPDQYSVDTENEEAKGKVVIQENRLKAGYEFLGWSTSPTGDADPAYAPGTTVDLRTVLASAPEVDGKKTLTLYAQATYNGTLQVAISFMQGDKRYFLTHPNSSAPRYARARHFDNWETTWQGMENAENQDPNYVSTFEVRCPVVEVKKRDGGEGPLDPKEHVLDPRNYTMHGYEDSLTFYEFFHPADDEYLGLYYTTPNTILANNTWAGLFTTTDTETPYSWPTYLKPYISGVKIKSERYVEEYDPVHKPDSLILKKRLNYDKPYVKYNATDDQFDGGTEGEATTFDISAVSVADARYVVIPDTSYAWKDTIEFGYHNDEQLHEDVWSALIGKQFMAVMRLGDDTVYFHPNRDKIINDPNALYLSSDFRVTQIFDFIRDSRVTAPLNAGDSVMHETTSHYWHHNIVSGNCSPINIQDGEGHYIDIVDTFRITLSHGGISKIKEYRGR